MREKLTTAPARAKQAERSSAVWVLLPDTRWKSSAMSAAPVVCPTRRAVASMPLALPLRWGGAEAMRMLLLGDWKRAKPAPQSISRQIISPWGGLSGRKASSSSPAHIAVRPMPPSSPAWMRSTR